MIMQQHLPVSIVNYGGTQTISILKLWYLEVPKQLINSDKEQLTVGKTPRKSDLIQICTGMDKTSLDTSSGSLYWNGQNKFVHQLWEFICEGLAHSVWVSTSHRM